MMCPTKGLLPVEFPMVPGRSTLKSAQTSKELELTFCLFLAHTTLLEANEDPVVLKEIQLVVFLRERSIPRCWTIS